MIKLFDVLTENSQLFHHQLKIQVFFFSFVSRIISILEFLFFFFFWNMYFCVKDTKQQSLSIPPLLTKKYSVDPITSVAFFQCHISRQCITNLSPTPTVPSIISHLLPFRPCRTFLIINKLKELFRLGTRVWYTTCIHIYTVSWLKAIVSNRRSSSTQGADPDVSLFGSTESNYNRIAPACSNGSQSSLSFLLFLVFGYKCVHVHIYLYIHRSIMFHELNYRQLERLK